MPSWNHISENNVKLELTTTVEPLFVRKSLLSWMLLLEVMCSPSCRLFCVTVVGAELSLCRGPEVSMLAVSVVQMCSYLFSFRSVLDLSLIHI